MDHLKLRNLLKAYREGKTTEHENALLEDWYFTEGNKAEDINSPIDYIGIEGRIWGKLSAQHDFVSTAPKQTKLWPRIAVAAAAVLAVVIGVWYFLGPFHAQRGGLYANDIAPGKNTATLTLSNGKSIALSDAKSGVLVGHSKLSYSDGTALLQGEGAPGMVERSMTLSTPRGGTYQITLSDGTKVWLNAASSLTYAAKLSSGGQRRVVLNGEAYFEVAKDKAHPFVVESRGQEVVVLGTHFNVNSYKDEPGITTTLLEGSVKVKVGNQQEIIKPGQQAINSSGAIAVRQIEVDNVVDWKNGDFYLNHMEFKTAMRKIARWYDMDIIYDESVPDNMESGGWISRDRPLSAVLKSIESSGLVKFRVQGRKIYVMR